MEQRKIFAEVFLHNQNKASLVLAFESGLSKLMLVELKPALENLHGHREVVE